MLLAVLLLLLLLLLLPRDRAHKVGSRLMHRPSQGTTVESSNGVHGRSRWPHILQHAMSLGAGALQGWVNVRGSSRRLHQQRHPAARSPVPGRSHWSHRTRIRTSTHNKEKATRPPRTSERGARLQQSTRNEEKASRPPCTSKRGVRLPQSTHNQEKVSRVRRTKERWARLQQRGQKRSAHGNSQASLHPQGPRCCAQPHQRLVLRMMSHHQRPAFSPTRGMSTWTW